MEKEYPKAKKDLYCPVCKLYPDVVKEVYEWAIETRVWNKDCYELEDVDYGDYQCECEKCGSLVEVRAQEEIDEPTPLPEVSGKVSKDKDIFPEDGSYNDKE